MSCQWSGDPLHLHRWRCNSARPDDAPVHRACQSTRCRTDQCLYRAGMRQAALRLQIVAQLLHISWNCMLCLAPPALCLLLLECNLQGAVLCCNARLMKQLLQVRDLSPQNAEHAIGERSRDRPQSRAAMQWTMAVLTIPASCNRATQLMHLEGGIITRFGELRPARALQLRAKGLLPICMLQLSGRRAGALEPLLVLTESAFLF